MQRQLAVRGPVIHVDCAHGGVAVKVVADGRVSAQPDEEELLAFPKWTMGRGVHVELAHVEHPGPGLRAVMNGGGGCEGEKGEG